MMPIHTSLIVQNLIVVYNMYKYRYNEIVQYVLQTRMMSPESRDPIIDLANADIERD
jgi:hypothetical protein